MQEAQILYVVEGLVTVGLAAWVARVLATAPREGPPAHRAPEVARDAASPFVATAVGRSETGTKGEAHADAYLVLDDPQVGAVAEGAGERSEARIAAKLAVGAIEQAFARGTRPDAVPGDEAPGGARAKELRDAIVLANERLWKTSQGGEAGAGAAVVAAYFAAGEKKVHVARVGRARCFRLRGGQLVALTGDDAGGHALGTEAALEVEVRTEAALPGDLYLLCSEALTRALDAKVIEGALGGDDDLERAATKLIELASATSGGEEITALLARVNGPRGASPAEP